ncbi:Dynein heavy chain 3, axonemal, partial [Coelomomyces lativittatus]
MFGNFLSDGSKRIYDEIEHISSMTELVERSLQEYNALSKKQMDLVMFRFAIEHLVRISRILFQVEITKNYSLSDWHDDIKKMMRKAGGE